MVTAANTLAVLCFAVVGAVYSQATLLVGIGALAGGYLDARAGRRLPTAMVRAGALLIAAGMTASFFLRGRA